ncbi:MAG: hypothetical protein ACAF41_26785 [Leptolyngbya sp. BL-A-14]
MTFSSFASLPHVLAYPTQSSRNLPHQILNRRNTLYRHNIRIARFNDYDRRKGASPKTT